MCTYVWASENAKLVSKYALKVSQRICQSFLFRCVLWFLFLFWKESKDQKLRCKFSLLSTQNLRKLLQTMRTKRMGERDWREREVNSLKRKQRRRKLKAIFNFLSWRKLKNLLQPPAQHTHKHTHIYICTHRDKLKFVFRYLKIPRSCAQASRN